MTPINPLLKDSDVIHIIQEAGIIDTVFVHKNNFRTMKKVLKKVELKNVILIGAEEARPNTITFEEFIKDSPSTPLNVNIDPLNDIAALLFTGGTTGLPKGVMLTHNNLVADALSTLYMGGVSEETEEDFGKTVNLSILPLCHTFGFEVMIIALVGGAICELAA